MFKSDLIGAYRGMLGLTCKYGFVGIEVLIINKQSIVACKTEQYLNQYLNIFTNIVRLSVDATV